MSYLGDVRRNMRVGKHSETLVQCNGYEYRGCIREDARGDKENGYFDAAEQQQQLRCF